MTKRSWEVPTFRWEPYSTLRQNEDKKKNVASERTPAHHWLHSGRAGLRAAGHAAPRGHSTALLRPTTAAQALQGARSLLKVWVYPIKRSVYYFNCHGIGDLHHYFHFAFSSPHLHPHWIITAWLHDSVGCYCRRKQGLFWNTLKSTRAARPWRKLLQGWRDLHLNMTLSLRATHLDTPKKLKRRPRLNASL